MQAIRVIKEPLNHQVVIDLPPGLDTAKRVEVIVLGIEDRGDAAVRPLPGTVRRRPSSRLAGTEIRGDLMAPAVPDEDWGPLA